MREHNLFCTFLHDALRGRAATVEHFAGELGHADTAKVQSWFDGHALPPANELEPLARLLQVSPVVLTAGWLIEHHPDQEERIWARLLEPLGSPFPKSSDLTLRAARARNDYSVGDPFDAREPSPAVGHARLRRKERRRGGPS